MKKELLILLLFCIGCNHTESRDELDILRPEEMQEDIHLFFREIRNIHPDLYERYDSATFVSLESRMTESCSSPMSLYEFKIQLLKTSKFLDGHTGFHISPMIGSYHFPAVRFEGDQMILEEDRILSIQNKSASALALSIDSMVSWEFLPEIRNERKNLLLNRMIRQPIAEPYSYECTLKKGERVYPVSIPASFSDDSTSVKKDSNYMKPYASTFYPKHSIAVLYYNTCWFLKEKEKNDFVQFIDSFFKELTKQKIKALFIDVTVNGGGNGENGTILLNRLIKNTLSVAINISGKKEGVERFCNSGLPDDEWVKTYGLPMIKDGFSNHKQLFFSKKDYYPGDVFIRMGNQTFSAAADFCLYARQSSSALLVGETAGQRYPICGNIIFGNLPNSGIKYQIPTTKAEFISPLIKDGYIHPDIVYKINHALNLTDYKTIINLNAKGRHSTP